MRAKLYTTFFTTMIVGIVAGYGVVSLARLTMYFVSSLFEDRNSEVVEQYENGTQDQDAALPNTESNFIRRAISYVTKNGGYHVIHADMAFPKLTAGSYLIADLDTGEIIKSYDSFVEHPIASVSKLMTALVALKNIDQGATTRVSYSAVSTYGTQGGLRAGENLTVSALMRALLLQSSNDAAEVLAEVAGRDDFISKMNSEAEYLGMRNTRFSDPSGLSEKNVSSADDLLRLAQYVYRSYPEIIDMTHERMYRVGSHLWYNNNVFVNDSKYVGGKNGYTEEANHTLVALFKLPLGSDSESRTIAIILLDGERNEKDVRAIILYLLRNIEFY